MNKELNMVLGLMSGEEYVKWYSLLKTNRKALNFIKTFASTICECLEKLKFVDDEEHEVEFNHDTTIIPRKQQAYLGQLRFGFENGLCEKQMEKCLYIGCNAEEIHEIILGFLN